MSRLGERAEELGPRSSRFRSSSSRYSPVEVDYQLALIEAERQFIGGRFVRIKEEADYVRTWKGFHAGPRPGGGTQST